MRIQTDNEEIDKYYDRGLVAEGVFTPSVLLTLSKLFSDKSFG